MSVPMKFSTVLEALDPDVEGKFPGLGRRAGPLLSDGV